VREERESRRSWSVGPSGEILSEKDSDARFDQVHPTASNRVLQRDIEHPSAF
jgi:hypothetical protein